tara:strand:+ start:248 stop:523 length:276 start_codon:yes stop_codon:yes gene_type:complete
MSDDKKLNFDVKIPFEEFNDVMNLCIQVLGIAEHIEEKLKVMVDIVGDQLSEQVLDEFGPEQENNNDDEMPDNVIQLFKPKNEENDHDELG